MFTPNQLFKPSQLFTPNQLRLAQAMKSAGLPWEPGIGQYAWDYLGSIGPNSPFQNGVYFFLDFPCFKEYFGSVEALTSAMIWLPTVEQATQIAKWRGIPSDEIQQAVLEGIPSNQELDRIYETLVTEFSRGS